MQDSIKDKRIAELEQQLAKLRNFEMNDGTKIDLMDIDKVIHIIAYRGKCFGLEQQAKVDRERIEELEWLVKDALHKSTNHDWIDRARDALAKIAEAIEELAKKDQDHAR